ncbi:MAG TPA: hypothetical protein VEK56_14945 [Vicinamibacterales bacterium]|nr:hypothetical protein [Vicinamibacterales bacterium]
MLRGFQVVVSGLTVAAMVLAGAAVAHAQQPPAPQQATPQQPTAPAAPQQATAPVLTLDGDVALVTILIKPDKTADFELVLNKLKEALAKSDKPERKAQAAGWKIYKSAQMAQGNVVYIFLINPVVKGQEYDISRLIAEVFPVEVQEIFAKYKEAFAGRAITPLTSLMSMQ